jgi:excisionase family DNA binding protein
VPAFPTVQDRPYFSASELARVCGVNSHAIDRCIHRGDIPARRDGNRWRIEHADALRFYDRVQTATTTSSGYWRQYRQWRAAQVGSAAS